ncbi:uncharacterized protein GGS25DRAFT_495001 [Hypoxylon fragiforme]|uniref:uncharacterized protein n=1 Tax=Hypoxylon fragiforme TaxID=63214 RepID=UPI0020C5CE70|nr:uncharacterized protein GGS25DRAFT_495001 [Hypoxylon fragiforme]KAI2607264.1 hypothetical protein GGS25DRAFT_495001 [Hypoxylon fragiforme]
MALSKRTNFTTISPLPAGVTREAVISFLHSHVEMIDLNPLVIERHPIPPPAHAPAEEQRCVWWSLTDKISYLPGGVATGDITYTAAFHDLPTGIQTHVYAPMGTEIRERWSLNGTLPGEPLEPVELGIGAPRQGLYLREDVELRCNFMMSSFVKKTLKKAHGTLVARLLEKSQVTSRATPAAVQAAVATHHTGSSVGSYSSATSNRATPTSSSGARAGSIPTHSVQQRPGSSPYASRETEPFQAHPYGHRSALSAGHHNHNPFPEPLRINRMPSPGSAGYGQSQGRGGGGVPPRKNGDWNDARAQGQHPSRAGFAAELE